MKKVTVFLGAMMFIVSLSATVGATTYTFEPSDHDLYDLDHGHFYTWGIDLDVPDNETITGASLFFDDIRNWNSSENDLWVHLLEDASLGIKSYTDDRDEQVDAFDGQGTLLHQWHNLPDTPQDITYDFETNELNALIDYSSNGDFGLGFDPDCHFYNNGITLTIETTSSVIPEPGSVLLLGAGLVGLIALRRKVLHKR